MGVREGEEQSGAEGEQRKGRVNEYVCRKMSRRLSTTWSEHISAVIRILIKKKEHHVLMSKDVLTFHLAPCEVQRSAKLVHYTK